jgi:tetratricopeptide (TPR) repeat protein
MSIQFAEQHFAKGLAALAEERALEAADCFLAAMQAEAGDGARRPDMRYLSYYGLSLAKASYATASAVQACELAYQSDPLQPTVLLNLGRVYLLTGRTAQALGCFERGVRLAPAHRALRRELAQANRRGRPLFSFLDRSNPLNRWTGRLRSALRARTSAAAEAQG